MRTRWIQSWTEIFSGVSIEDDRGRRVPLVKRGSIGEGLSDFKRRELRSRIPIDRMKILVGVLMLIGAGLASRVAWLAITGQPIFVSGWWRLPQNNLIMVFWVSATLANVLRTNPKLDYTDRIVTPCLKWGVCASCGYSLRDAALHDDGRAVCSECGAAWDASRVGAS